MSYQILSRKYRPQIFEGIAGQVHVTRTLQNAIRLNRVAHGYLFTGPRGIGKTTAARILAKSLNCQHYKDSNPCGTCVNCVEITEGRSIDVQEIDGASNRGIDEIRDLREAVKYHPATGKYRIYIIDEVHMLTHQAFNALLKTLEEPPPHVIFIMATTDPQKIPQTILSRTQRFDFKRLTTSDITTYLGEILTEEGLCYDKGTLELIAAKADGSMRDSLSLLDQVIAYCENEIDQAVVKDVLGIIEDSLFLDLLISIRNAEFTSLLKSIAEVVDAGYSISNFVEGFNEFLRKCLLILSGHHDGVRIAESVGEWISENKAKLSTRDLLRMIEIVLKFEARLRFIQQPRVALEALFLKLAAMDSTILISELLGEYTPASKPTAANLSRLNPPKKVTPKENTAIPAKKTPTTKVESKKSPALPKVKEPSLIAEPTTSAKPARSEIKVTVDFELIKEKWPDVLQKLEAINFKIAHFLAGSELVNYTDGLVEIQLNNENGFTVRSLEKDKPSIEKIIFEVIGTSVRIKFRSNPDQAVEKKTKPLEPEKDHPLMMDVIEMFNGEIIR